MTCRVPLCLATQLTRANAWMARLDLVAETFAPIVVALIVSYANKCAYTANLIAFLFVAAWNWGTAPLEYVLLRRLCESQPSLQASKSATTVASDESEGALNCSALANSWELFSYDALAQLVAD